MAFMSPSSYVQWGLGLGEVPLGLAHPIEVPSVNHVHVCATSQGSVPLTQLHPQHEPFPSGGPYWLRGKLFGGADPARPPEARGPPHDAFPKRPPAYPGRYRSTALRGIGEISEPWPDAPGAIRPTVARNHVERSMAGSEASLRLTVICLPHRVHTTPERILGLGALMVSVARPVHTGFLLL